MAGLVRNTSARALIILSAEFLSGKEVITFVLLIL